MSWAVAQWTIFFLFWMLTLFFIFISLSLVYFIRIIRSVRDCQIRNYMWFYPHNKDNGRFMYISGFSCWIFEPWTPPCLFNDKCRFTSHEAFPKMNSMLWWWWWWWGNLCDSIIVFLVFEAAKCSKKACTEDAVSTIIWYHFTVLPTWKSLLL